MNVYPCLLYLLLFFFFPVTAIAQGDSYTHYNTKNGLAGATVYGMTQDRDGYIWFGTETGLSRFDGSTFKNFSLEDGLPGNQVFGLYTDTRNRVWIATFKNEICYYLNGKIHNTKNDTTLKKIALKTHVIRITEDLYGDLLFNCVKTNYLLKRNGQVMSIPNLAPAATQPFFQPVSGMLNINTSHVKLPRYVQKRLTGKLLLIPPFGTADMRAQYAAHNSWLEPTVTDTMFFFPAGDTQCHLITLPYGTSHIKQVNAHTYAFIRGYNGVTLFNVKRPELTRDYFTDYPVNNVIEDKEKNLWFSTKGSGVFKIGKGNFKNYSFGELGVDYIESVNNKIYIGTDNGKLWAIQPVPNTRPGAVAEKKPEKITCGLKDLVAQKRTGYIMYAGSDFLNINQIKDAGAIKTIQYYQDTLLIAGSNGCFLFSAFDYRLLKTIYQGRVTCAYQKNGTVYVGTVACLRKISLAGQGDQVLLNTQISQIVENQDGALWMASYEHGLMRYQDGHVTAQLRKRNGLASDICNSLFISGHSLWAGTDKGLNKIDIRPDTPVVTRHFTETDGLISNMINTVYVSGHHVYVGTASGMTVFDEASVPGHAACNLKVERVLVSGKEKNPLADNFILPHKDNNIQFDLNGISFLPGAPPLLQYRLLGLSSRWQLSDERTLKYPSLPSGKYKLQVLAINKFGDKSPLIEYRFEILKTRWEHWWFWLLVIVVIMILTALIVRMIIRRSHLKEKEKLLNTQKIMELEQMALRAQMNPHFIFNSLNSVQQYIISHDVKNANNYLSLFATLVRQTLDNSPKIYIPVAEEIAFLKNYLELEKRQSLGAFTYTMTIDAGINQQTTLIPNMVLQPYVENAVKHGVRQLETGGRITISMRLLAEKQQLECTIADNGPGIDATSQAAKNHPDNYVPHGMSITRKRISTINQLNAGLKDIFVAVEDLHTLDLAARGTLVTILFQI